VDSEIYNSSAVGIFDGGSQRGGHLIRCGGGANALEVVASVPQRIVDQFHLRGGQEISGAVDGRRGTARYAQLTSVETIDGLDPMERQRRTPFLRATTVSPSKRLNTETAGGPLATRLIDLFAPLGKGQRALVVAPPKAGKTVLLQQIAKGVAENHPQCHLMVLLIDERPEEVTEFRRTVGAEMFASSNDEPTANHARIAQLAFDRAKSLAEAGRDVVLLLDSLTRLARACNVAMSTSGRTMSGGLDSRAMERPRQLFALARATEESGSLTTIATVLVETGSRMDELIFQEFKGTGNMEIVLDRKAAEQRLFPAINLQATGTRREELLLSPSEIAAAQIMRRAAAAGKPESTLPALMERMEKTKNNGELVDLLARR
jgi:transcription termination factor Rho